MNFMKICMDRGNEFEREELFDSTLSCPKCLSTDIYQVTEAEYDEITLENCFELYHENKVACMCNADEKSVIFMED